MSNPYSRETYINADEATRRSITFDMLHELLEYNKNQCVKCEQRYVSCMEGVQKRAEEYNSRLEDLEHTSVLCEAAKKRTWKDRVIAYGIGILTGITGRSLF